MAVRGKGVIAVVVSAQARENREYVRRLLRERQPEFAAALALVEALVEQELSKSGHAVTESSSRGGRRNGRRRICTDSQPAVVR